VVLLPRRSTGRLGAPIDRAEVTTSTAIQRQIRLEFSFIDYDLIEAAKDG
jgi:hypothetical protein